jgi:hypothetical protein
MDLDEEWADGAALNALAPAGGGLGEITGALLCDAVRWLCRQEPLFAAMVADPRLREVFFEELPLVPLPSPVASELARLQETQPEAWQHALRSAVTAGWLAACQGGTRYDLRLLAAAGLVHDLGMLQLDPVLSRPELELGAEQRRQLYSHPLVTVKLLELHHEYARELLRAVLEHHEALDGSGYPRQLVGSAISPWGRVLALTELVTAMFGSDRPQPGLRLSLALRMNHHRFDADLVQEVMQLLPAVPDQLPPPPAHPPVQELQAIEALLGRWPSTTPAGLPGALAAMLDAVRAQAAKVLRMQADAGSSAEQLRMLDPAQIDERLQAELDLVVRELAWQLRNLTRGARQRWLKASREAPPTWLQRWLDEAELLCARHLSG